MGVARSLRKLRMLTIHGHRAEVRGSRKLRMRTRNLMNLDSRCVLRFGQFPSIYSQLYSTCDHAQQTPIMSILFLRMSMWTCLR